jgi:prevent-host-death family protein
VETINIHEAKTQLSRLVEKASKGEPFVIAKAGKPLVKVVPLDVPLAKNVKRLGFLAEEGQTPIPDDFNRMGEDEILQMFEAGA